MRDADAMRGARGSAWLLAVTTLVVAAVGLVLLVWDWSTPVPRGFFGIRGFDGLMAVGFGGVGAAGHRLPGTGYVGWVEERIWVPFVTLITLYLFLLFPDGRLPSPRWRPVGWLGGAIAAIAAAGSAVTLGSDRPNLPGPRNPFGAAPAAVPLGQAGASRRPGFQRSSGQPDADARVLRVLLRPIIGIMWVIFDQS